MRPQRPGRGALAQEGVDRQQRGDPVAQVLDVGAVLRDGELPGRPLAPVVDVVADHVHRPGQDVRPRHELQILPDHPLRVVQRVGVPERLAEQLVPHRDVVEQFRRPGHVRADLATLDRPLVQRRGVHAAGADPLHRAGDEVGPRAFQRVQQRLVGVPRQHVVTVDEGEEFAGCALDAEVTGSAGAAVEGLDQDEPGVGGGAGAGGLRAVVGGSVVHHDHLQIAERLGGDGRQAVVKHISVVVKRHHDADTGSVHLATIRAWHAWRRRMLPRHPGGALPAECDRIVDALDEDLVPE